MSRNASWRYLLVRVLIPEHSLRHRPSGASVAPASGREERGPLPPGTTRRSGLPHSPASSWLRASPSFPRDRQIGPGARGPPLSLACDVCSSVTGRPAYPVPGVRRLEEAFTAPCCRRCLGHPPAGMPWATVSTSPSAITVPMWGPAILTGAKLVLIPGIASGPRARASALRRRREWSGGMVHRGVCEARGHGRALGRRCLRRVDRARWNALCADEWQGSGEVTQHSGPRFRGPPWCSTVAGAYLLVRRRRRKATPPRPSRLAIW